MSVSLTTLLSNFTEVATAVGTNIGNAFDIVTSNPLLEVFVGAAFLGVGIKFALRLYRTIKKTA
jgi:hypothetical protein